MGSVDNKGTFLRAKETPCVKPSPCSFSGIRYIFTAAGFLGYCIIYALRVNINVAIVAMVNGTAVYNKNTSSNECLAETGNEFNDTDYVLNIEDGEFDWSPYMQGMVLGAFYYGYCVSQIPGGRLSEMYGGKTVFGVGVLVTSLLTLLTPVAARFSVAVLIAVRIAEGLAQGVTMPAMHSMLGRWLPESEKNFLAMIVYNGINVGTIVAMPIAGVLCSSHFLGGWPSAFYVFGFCGCVWYVVWQVCVTDSPHRHPWITASELRYITADQKISHDSELSTIPWAKIFKSVPFWALIVTQLGQDWCFYTLLTDLPTFMSTILHFRIKENGLLSSLPYVSQTILSAAAGWIADTFILRKWCTIEYSRKFCNTVGCVSTAAGLIIICLIGCNVEWTVALFATLVGMGGFSCCGYMLNHLDLSPEYAGTLMGIANTISNLTGFITPVVVGALTENRQTRHQWAIVFIITVVILLFTCTIFLVFGTTKKQDWANAEDPEAAK